MKVIYFIHRISPSGGVKVLFQHLRLLKERGVEAEIVTLNENKVYLFGDKVRVIETIHPYNFNADICVATKPNDIQALFSAGIFEKIPVVHFIQGNEIGELENRIKVLFGPGTHFLKILGCLPKIFKYYRRKSRFKKAYDLPTIKMAVSKHICEGIEAGFRQDCFELSNGIDLSVFKPSLTRDDMKTKKQWRIVSIGSFRVKTKGINDLLSAVKLLKDAEFPVHLTRIAGVPIAEEEKRSGLVDSYYQCIPEGKVAELLKASDVMVLGSLEEEGFGLPALEAMACKVPCVLTLIPAFMSFSEKKDFACFVQPRNSQAIADGVRQIMMNKEYRDGLVRNGFQVAQKYSLETVGDKLEKFLSNALTKNK